ncbi:N-acetylmuramoyl-L-alanine amidase [Nocardia flavorosea]|uniref:peptidoglycan recognition protein family protein n=1 Tax=Nocardia flavorosea TaxID=53429 RepID=UPI001E619BA0|nr:N-acetylmuramoyl-L-alanine amidase [Nocardia flavorosea]
MSWTGDPGWLADVLRDAGLKVIEHDGWRNRGHGDFRDIRGVLCHHTAGGGPNDWRVVQYGRRDLAGPLAQLVLEKDGTFRVIAAGVCWHAGRGSHPGWPTDNANYHTIGIEAVSRGTPPWDWTPAQLSAYKIGSAAILRRIGRDSRDCVAHHEYSSEGKIDPAGIDMNAFRRDVQALIDNPTGDDMTPDERTMLKAVHKELTQKYPSRSKYRKDDKPVDTLAGIVLNVDGRVHEDHVEREALKRVEWAVGLVKREAAKGDAGAQAVLDQIEGAK